MFTLSAILFAMALYVTLFAVVGAIVGHAKIARGEAADASSLGILVAITALWTFFYIVRCLY